MKRKKYKSLYLREKIERKTYQNMFNFLIEELKRCEHIQVIEEKYELPYKFRDIRILEDHKYLCSMAINESLYLEDEEED